MNPYLTVILYTRWLRSDVWNVSELGEWCCHNIVSNQWITEIFSWSRL